ncbi:MAG: asparaginase [Pseudomonadota bacterium]|nr:asparaginase [Pseudomonadota bacterium]
MPIRPRVLFLYTGGTLGMLKRTVGPADAGSPFGIPLAPSHVAEDVLSYVRGLEEEVDVEGELLCNLDSSDMGPPHWARIGGAIAARIHRYDGFVVLHGTDTMAWTACALSYALRGLPKPVVLTGSQRPIAFVRTDARVNLVHSALCATMDVPEVGIYFGRWLFRGNRATKTSIQAYDAFESPDLPPLVEMGVEVLRRTPSRRPVGPFQPTFAFEEEVVVLDIVPGSAPRALQAVVSAGVRGVVLRAFGAGNVPQRGWPSAIQDAVASGVAVALHSQCLRGTVDLSAYEGGRAALDAGALPTGSMTLEAATVKLMFLLAQGLTGDALRAAYTEDLAGEGAAGDRSRSVEAGAL